VRRAPEALKRATGVGENLHPTGSTSVDSSTSIPVSM
jgi:hypothetical protein